MMENQMFDVFISGAGPVGLFFAYQVNQSKHSSYHRLILEIL